MGYGAIEAATGEPIRELLTIGGGARSALMRQIVADVTGRPVRVSSTLEASCLGAGMLAASGAGWYASPAEARAAMQGEVELTVEPGRRAGRALSPSCWRIYRDLYPALRTTFARLAAYRARLDG